MADEPTPHQVRTLQAIAERRVRCERIVAKARAAGLNVTWDKVNRNFQWFVRWDEGRLATGYLMRRTGVRRL